MTNTKQDMTICDYANVVEHLANITWQATAKRGLAERVEDETYLIIYLLTKNNS